MKKLLAILLALVMVFALAACAGNTTTSSKEEPAASQGGTESKEDPASSEGTDEPTSVLPYTGDEITLDYYWFDTGDDWSSDDYPMIEELYNQIGNIRFKVDILPLTDYNTRNPIMLAGGEVCDLMLLNDVYNYVSYAENDIFLNLNEYADVMPNVQAKYDTAYALKSLTSEDGELWAISLGFLDLDSTQTHFMANKTILDELNIAIPTTDVEFLEALRKVKAEKPDVMPWSPRGNMGSTISYIGYMYGGATQFGMVYDRAAGKWTYTPIAKADALKKTIEFVSTMWAEELMSHEINTQIEEDVLDRYYGGKAAFTYDYVIRMSHDGTKTAPFTKTGYQSEVFATPNGGDAGVQVVYQSDGAANWACFVGADTEYPEIVAAFLDYTLSDDYFILYNWGVEGVTFEYDADGNPQFMEALSLPVLGYNEGKSLADFGSWKHPVLRGFTPQAKDARRATEEAPWVYEQLNAVEAKMTSGELDAIYNYGTPVMSEDDAAEYSEIMGAVNTFYSENIIKFAMCEKSMDEWDAFMAELSAFDIARAEEILNGYEVPELTGLWR